MVTGENLVCWGHLGSGPARHISHTLESLVRGQRLPLPVPTALCKVAGYQSPFRWKHRDHKESSVTDSCSYREAPENGGPVGAGPVHDTECTGVVGLPPSFGAAP